MAKKKTNTDELGELDRIYTQITGRSAAPQKRRGGSAALICIACVLLLAALGGGVWLLFSDYWLTMPAVTVAGMNMEGLTKREAKEALQTLVQEQHGQQTMTVTVMDTTLELPAADTAIRVDVNTAINEAYRSAGEFDLVPHMTLNEVPLNALLTQLGDRFNADLEPTEYTVEGDLPDLSKADAPGGQTLCVVLGSPQLGLDVEALRSQILGAYSRSSFQVTGQCTVIPPEMPTAELLYERHLTAPVDAVMDPKTFRITDETYGYSVDAAQAAKLLKNAQYGDSLRIPFAVVLPEVTAEDLWGLLYQDVLGECTTPYGGSDSGNRNVNLGLACQKIDGFILLPGETFSYNMTLGERNAENGWKPAASYVGGLTVDTYGGGICQGSTTLYNCVLQADLPIVECYPHGYLSSYIDPGLDASVNWGTADFRFTNSTDWPIKIEASRKNGKMTMRLLGTDQKDYYVKMSYKILNVKDYETIYEEVDPANNPRGYTDGQVLIEPYKGYTVKTYKNRYDKTTGQLIETVQERYFVYSTRNLKVVKFVIPGETTPGETTSGETPPGETTSGETPPGETSSGDPTP